VWLPTWVCAVRSLSSRSPTIASAEWQYVRGDESAPRQATRPLAVAYPSAIDEPADEQQTLLFGAGQGVELATGVSFEDADGAFRAWW